MFFSERGSSLFRYKFYYFTVALPFVPPSAQAVIDDANSILELVNVIVKVVILLSLKLSEPKEVVERV